MTAVGLPTWDLIAVKVFTNFTRVATPFSDLSLLRPKVVFLVGPDPAQCRGHRTLGRTLNPSAYIYFWIHCYLFPLFYHIILLVHWYSKKYIFFIIYFCNIILFTSYISIFIKIIVSWHEMTIILYNEIKII